MLTQDKIWDQYNHYFHQNLPFKTLKRGAILASSVDVSAAVLLVARRCSLWLHPYGLDWLMAFPVFVAFLAFVAPPQAKIAWWDNQGFCPRAKNQPRPFKCYVRRGLGGLRPSTLVWSTEPSVSVNVASKLWWLLRHSFHWPRWSRLRIGFQPILERLHCGRSGLCRKYHCLV